MVEYDTLPLFKHEWVMFQESLTKFVMIEIETNIELSQMFAR